MTNQDDWESFCEMMAAAGWVQSQMIFTFGERLKQSPVSLLPESYTWDDFMDDINQPLSWRYNPQSGKLWPSDGRKPQYLGDWREWLKAGASPPPF